MIKIGLLGCGNIGRIIVKNCVDVEIVALYDRLPERVEQVGENVTEAIRNQEFQDFITEPFDIAVEAASIGAVQEYGEKVLRAGKDLIVLSVGAFADKTFRNHLEELARSLDRTIRIPSGALFGLDNLKIGQVSHLERVLLRTTKKPTSLGLELTERRLLYQGSAAECIKLYPRNVNVAVALSLAADREVEVELWADPGVERNSHEVIITGEFGDASLATYNLPCPDNPATSYLAALSIIALLRNLGKYFLIGT